MRYYRIALIILLAVSLCSQLACGPRKLNAMERLTVKRIRPLCWAVKDYRIENMYYPEDWDELLDWKRAKMPINPYTDAPMVVLESREYDPDLSPGNIYYHTVKKDGAVINYYVIIFGARGEIMRYPVLNRFTPK